MVKKKQKKIQQRRAKFAVKGTTKRIADFEKGFFERFKDILPDQKKETVRVKTYIVEKPVFISPPTERVRAQSEKYDLEEGLEDRIDSRKSRYSKKKQIIKDPLEKELNEDEALEPEQEVEEDLVDDGSELDEGEEPIDENVEYAQGEEAVEAMPRPGTHIRSRAMSNNVWWKKALFWAILVWLFILGVSMGMQALKLIQVDLTRQWWILLAGIIVIALIYFKFLDGKF